MAETPIRVGVCICPLSDEEANNNTKEIITADGNEIKISMGEGRGLKSYELDFEVLSIFNRSSRSQMFFKISVLKNFAIFTGNHPCWSLFLIKLQDAYNFIKRRLQQRCFPANIAKFLKTAFL